MFNSWKVLNHYFLNTQYTNFLTIWVYKCHFFLSSALIDYCFIINNASYFSYKSTKSVKYTLVYQQIVKKYSYTNHMTICLKKYLYKVCVSIDYIIVLDGCIKSKTMSLQHFPVHVNNHEPILFLKKC